MYLNSFLTGASLAPGTLCLTYDDGPGQREGADRGPNTLALAEYLHRQRIRATFFMTGLHAERYPDLVQRVQELGHLVANHTFTHPHLPNLHEAGGDVADEILQTDRLIRRYIPGGITYFRPPYLEWSEAVATALNSNVQTALRHVGPIGADHFLDDYSHWTSTISDEERNGVADGYFNLITAHGGRNGRGIILMHDNSVAWEERRRNNRTYELTQNLVPRLKALDYMFVGLESIPALGLAAAIPLVCGLRASNGKYISVQPGIEGTVMVNGPRFDAWENLRVESISPNQVALRAPDGRYLSPQEGGGREVLANGPRIGTWEHLDVIPVGTGRIALRTINGRFLTRETPDGGRLMASAEALRDWEVFTFENHSL